VPLRQHFRITGTSPATASTGIIAGSVRAGLERFDSFTIDAQLVGATGGSLDVYIQRQVTTASEVSGGVWADWLHFPQLASGAAAIKYSVQSGVATTIFVVGGGTDASAGTPALAANSFVGGHPGHAIRVVCVAGASTSAGAALVIDLIGLDGLG
jgi:hypothetical protein